MTQKQTVWRMAALALTFALVLVACDNDSPDNNKPGSKGSDDNTITYTASADGTSGTTTSTKITFTFNKAVTGLAAANITVTNGTGSVTVGDLTGSDKIWALALSTVTTQGNVTVKIAQTGISSATKTVAVYKEGATPPVGADPVGGMTTYVRGGDDGYWRYTINFKAADTTYTISKPKYVDEDEMEYDLKDGKYQWEVQKTGTYTWNTTIQTITLTPTKIDGMSKAEYRAAHQAKIGGMFDSYDEETLAALLKMYYGVTTIDELMDLLVDMSFADETYDYSFSADNEVLFIQEALPAPKGTDELSGKTYYEANRYWYDDEEDYVYQKFEEHTFQFDTNGTYTNTYDYGDGTKSSTGSYSYDSTSKLVYLRLTGVGDNGLGDKTPAEYYASLMADEDLEWDQAYPNKAAYCMALANGTSGSVDSYNYDSTEMIIFE